MKLAALEMYQNIQVYNKTEKKFYLVYCRKSSESEDRQMQSIEDQLTATSEILQRRNISALETFTESQSAKMPGRPEFNRMIEGIYQRHDIKGVICWKLNRLARNPIDEGKLRWLLQSGEIEEIITPEKVYTQVDSDFVMAIEGSQAQRFITDLKKDTARGIQSKLDKGIAPILAPPGYRNAVEKRQGERDILPHPLYFSIMRKVFDLALTGNYSGQQLCLKAEEMGIKNSRGQFISRTQMYKILRDPFYTGTRYIYASKLYTNGTHKAMISDEEYDLLQEILDKRTQPRGQIREDTLTGLFTCGECGRGITSEYKRKKLKNGSVNIHGYYRCTKKWKGKKCSQRYIRTDELEKQINEALDGIKLSSKFVEWAIKWLNVMHESQKEQKEARYESTKQAYEETSKKIDRLVDLMLSGIVSTEEGAIKKQMLDQEKQRLFQTLSKIDTHATEWNHLAIQTFDFIKTVKEKFNNGTIEQRKTILRVIGSNLVLKDRKLTIELRTPFAYIQKVANELKESKEASSVRENGKWVADGTKFEPKDFSLPSDLQAYFSTLESKELAFYRTAYAFS